MPSPFVIAEFGSCHEGDLDKAIEGIRVAKEAGADAWKCQFWSSPERMRERRKIQAPAYETGSLKAEWLEPLMKAAHNSGLKFSASVFLPEDIDTLSPYLDYWKVSSFEARDRDLTRLIPRDRQLFISTGMMTEHELSYIPNRAIRLHCVSAYPCLIDEANLGAIERGHGYSDHTKSVFTGAFAVSAGANYLEVHYRLNGTSQSCPDYPVSLSPEGLVQYVALARTAYRMRGDGRKVPREGERANMAYRVTK